MTPRAARVETPADTREADLRAQCEEWAREADRLEAIYPKSAPHRARVVALREVARDVVNVLDGRLTGLAAHYGRVRS